jgi:hypothetical protein
MSLIQELEDIIRRTGSYKDREILLKVLEQLKKDARSSTWGFFEETKIARR